MAAADSGAAVEVSACLLGGRAILRSSFAPFMQYARTHVAVLGAAPAQAPLILDATLHWHEGPPAADRHGANPSLLDMERVDRDVYVSPGQVRWLRIDDLPALYLRVDWDGSHLRVRGDYYFVLSDSVLRDRARRWLTPADVAARRATRFTTLLYYLLYYPAFWLSETRDGFHPIHAAGVVTDTGAVLLAGPSGVGKSTLAVALTAAGAELLSETFVLHRGTTVRPVREPILLDAHSQEWLGDAMQGLDPIGKEFVFARNGFHCTKRLADEGEVTTIVLPRRANRTYVRAIDAVTAQRHISASNQIVKDSRRYWAFAAVMESLAPCGLMLQREQDLVRLTAGARCFELGIGPNLQRDEAVRTILELAASHDAASPLRARR